MRKSLLKTIVATAVVGATMALSSVAAMADITNTSINTAVIKTTFNSISGDNLAKYYDYIDLSTSTGNESSAIDTVVTSNNNAITEISASLKYKNADSGMTANGSTKYYKLNSQASNDCIKGLKAGQTAIIEYYLSSDVSGKKFYLGGTVDGASKNSKTSLPIQIAMPSTKGMYQLNINVSKDTDVYVYFDNGICVNYIAINDVARSAKAYGSTDLYALDPA